MGGNTSSYSCMRNFCMYSLSVSTQCYNFSSKIAPDRFDDITKFSTMLREWPTIAVTHMSCMLKLIPVRPGLENDSVPDCIVIFMINFFILPEILVPGTSDRYRLHVAARPTFPRLCKRRFIAAGGGAHLGLTSPDFVHGSDHGLPRGHNWRCTLHLVHSTSFWPSIGHAPILHQTTDHHTFKIASWSYTY
jgi:hypothetical protein